MDGGLHGHGARSIRRRDLLVLLTVVAALATIAVVVVRRSSRPVPVIGDSITFLASHDISSALGGAYHAEIHGGVGKRIDEMLPILGEELREHPFAVVVDLGTNDVLQARTHPDWQRGFERMIAMLVSSRCVVMTTISTRVDGPSASPEVAAEINDAIAMVVTSHRNFHAVDWNAAVHGIDGASLLVADRIHPSPAGQLTLAAL